MAERTLPHCCFLFEFLMCCFELRVLWNFLLHWYLWISFDLNFLRWDVFTWLIIEMICDFSARLFPLCRVLLAAIHLGNLSFFLLWNFDGVSCRSVIFGRLTLVKIRSLNFAFAPQLIVFKTLEPLLRIDFDAFVVEVIVTFALNALLHVKSLHAITAFVTWEDENPICSVLLPEISQDSTFKLESLFLLRRFWLLAKAFQRFNLLKNIFLWERYRLDVFTCEHAFAIQHVYLAFW